MKASEIHIGAYYLAKVSGKVVTVRVESITEVPGRHIPEAHRPIGGRSKYPDRTVYGVTNLDTGRKTTFRSAQRFRSLARIGASQGGPTAKWVEPSVDSLHPEGL